MVIFSLNSRKISAGNGAPPLTQMRKGSSFGAVEGAPYTGLQVATFADSGVGTASDFTAVIDWGDITAGDPATDLANFGSRNGPLEVERGTLAQSDLGAAFTASGSTVTATEMTSGLAIIERRDGHFEGSADPRREGTAIGD